MRRTIERAAALLICLIMVTYMSGTSGQASLYTQAQRNKNTAHQIAEMLRAEGHPETHPVILACQEWWRAEDAAEAVAETYTTKEQRAAYPVAAAVWQQLREAGLSEACAAGILGNMAVECGGLTLDLDPYIYSGGYYGLCMWSLFYCPEVDGRGVPGQVQFLLDTLESNIQTGGGSLDTFLKSPDAGSAARYFSDFYERPAAWAQARADCAAEALAFFGSGV